LRVDLSQLELERQTGRWGYNASIQQLTVAVGQGDRTVAGAA